MSPSVVPSLAPEVRPLLWSLAAPRLCLRRHSSHRTVTEYSSRPPRPDPNPPVGSRGLPFPVYTAPITASGA